MPSRLGRQGRVSLYNQRGRDIPNQTHPPPASPSTIPFHPILSYPIPDPHPIPPDPYPSHSRPIPLPFSPHINIPIPIPSPCLRNARPPRLSHGVPGAECISSSHRTTSHARGAICPRRRPGAPGANMSGCPTYWPWTGRGIARNAIPHITIAHRCAPIPSGSDGEHYIPIRYNKGRGF